eukprot:CAMPEP_0205937778 /NCGR_PEP_ID=MMETSP1325-20131115/45052_1 /ASSEMBLY_ACC=CAM_ASM_000708 /TAXON_ID=236786 /ORGANISM="Florenciella sp., Strain RCC1007" /LENGTH=38 /DNA_ID= /DNA_START= /DNA_END= /DNA_ORIENTATION=
MTEPNSSPRVPNSCLAVYGAGQNAPSFVAVAMRNLEWA